MRKITLSLIFFISVVSCFAQSDTIKTVDTIYEVDTMSVLKVESPNKMVAIFEDVSKIFNIREYETKISRLDNIVLNQNMYIDSLSNVLLGYWEGRQPEPAIKEDEIKMLQADVVFLESLPASYAGAPKENLQSTMQQIDNKILELRAELDSLVKAKADNSLIQSKENTLTALVKERSIIDLTIKDANLKDENQNLHGENDNLRLGQDTLKKYLYIAIGIAVLLGLVAAVVLQRRRISVQDVELEKQLNDISRKNSYLEHAAKIIRHDMHSGINTYMPRGISSLEKRLTIEDISKLKIEGALKMVKEGLNHTQRVYKSVYEFTNLVKSDVVLNKVRVDLKELLQQHIASNSYSSQVNIADLGELEVNDVLFCNAIENLIKNGLTYNDSEVKSVSIYKQEDCIVIQDNGRGLSQKQFEKQLAKYSKKDGATEREKGLGLSICVAILEEHGFKLSCERNDIGTKMKIKIKND